MGSAVPAASCRWCQAGGRPHDDVCALLEIQQSAWIAWSTHFGNCAACLRLELNGSESFCPKGEKRWRLYAAGGLAVNRAVADAIVALAEGPRP